MGLVKRNSQATRGGKKRKRSLLSYLESEAGLLAIFIASTVVVSISTLVVPWTLVDQAHELLGPGDPQHHSVGNHLKQQSVITQQHHLEKKSAEEISSKIVRPKADAVSNTKGIQEASNSTEGYFLTHATPYHTIFSTGCSIFQDWQSYVFFYHVMQSGQEGHVTRIASGCNRAEKQQLQEMFGREISVMRPGIHHLHQTPDFSHVPKKEKKKFKYFNKPFGVRHWMEHALGYPDNHKLHDDSIIILMDPDQIVLRPFTNDFTNSSEVWRSPKKAKLKVEHGSPFAQQYGYGLQWLHQVNATYVFEGSSPVSELSRKDAFDYYSAMGPPYIATAKDMWSIVNKWSEIAPRVHDEYPHLLAEMFAYNLAIAHLGMRHTVAHSFHASDPRAGGEAWKLLDKVPESQICRDFPVSEMPHVMHYCQRYYLGKWFIGKYQLRKDFISCESPLLREPPRNVTSKYTTAILPNDKKERKEIPEKQRKRYGFMLCHMIEALNAAAKYYKDQHCEEGTANYEYSYTFHEDMTMPDEAE